MALLTRARGVGCGVAGRWLGLACWLLAGGAELPAQPAANEYEVKAVFLFNFSQFVEWPPQAFADAQAPFIIGVLGEDPFGKYLDDTVRGEKVNGRPLVVQRFSRVEDVKTCHILFISKPESGGLKAILAALKGRNILTVGDMAGFAQAGGMIELATDKNKLRLRINVEAARPAGVTISSKLLRPAEIVSAGTQ